MPQIKQSKFRAFFQNDMSNVGTDDYKGYGYFWSYKYRHDLRDTTPNIRRKIHFTLLSQGLSLNGDSEQHDKVVNRFCSYKEHKDAICKKTGSNTTSYYTQDPEWY
tara:strand:+ start:117 stop:434 length:318 start_codon:yes stop_codon:yes gene_type:complete